MAKAIWIAVTIMFCTLSVSADRYLRDRIFRRRLPLSSAQASASASALSHGDGFGSSRAAAAAEASTVFDGFGRSSSRANSNAVAESLSRNPYFDDIIPYRRGGDRFARCQYDQCSSNYDCYRSGERCVRDSYGCYRCVYSRRGIRRGHIW